MLVFFWNIYIQQLLLKSILLMSQKNLSVIFHSARSIATSTIYQSKLTNRSHISAKYFQNYRQRNNSNRQKQRTTNKVHHKTSQVLKQFTCYPDLQYCIVAPKLNQQTQKTRRQSHICNIENASFFQYKKNEKKTNLLSQMLRDLPKLRETGSTLCQSPKEISLKPVNFKKMDEFKKLKKLGRGKFGEVFLVKHKKTGLIAALKIIRKINLLSGTAQQNQKALNQLISQIKIQSFLSHPNLIKLYDFFNDETNIYLLLELAEDGHLFQLLEKHKSFSEETTSIIARQILQGVNYMHENDVIHRDIKLQNIVLCHGMAKICDFGWSVYSPSEFRSTLCGTPLYLSPQILLGHQYNKKIDSWAIGALTNQLFTGQNAFKIKRKDDLSKIITDDFQMTTGSIELRSFLTFILRKNPETRPGTQTIKKHPFIQKYKDLQTSDELCHFTSLKFIN